MAVKKSAKKKEASAMPAKAEAKETAPKKKAPKKAAAKAPAAEPTPAPVETPTPAPTPEPAAQKAAPKKAAPKKSGAKKAAPIVKLSASQTELLKKVGGAGEAGYTIEKKAEQKSIDSLLEKKLIKKGAKDKATGAIKYHTSTAGKKHTS